MKTIGEGWQYSVYDLGNGRVLKKFHSLPKAYWVILKTIFPFKNDPIWMIPKWARSMKNTALNSYEILKKRNLPNGWFANPMFIDSLDFEQDKVIPLRDALKGISVEEGKKLIDLFIGFNQKLLSAGIIDKSFNITKNFGLDQKGEIVLIDIGEIFDEPLRIEAQRKRRAWIEVYVADEIEDGEVRSYFIKRMDEVFGIK